MEVYDGTEMVPKEMPKDVEPITIVLKTQEEIDILFALLNYTPIIECIEGIGCNSFNEQLYPILLHRRSNDYLRLHTALINKLKRKDNGIPDEE